jgi:hypothetical protein
MVGREQEQELERYLVPPHLQQKALDSIPDLSRFTVKKGKEYFDSAEGKRRLETCLMIFSRNGAS